MTAAPRVHTRGIGEDARPARAEVIAAHYPVDTAAVDLPMAAYAPHSAALGFEDAVRRAVAYLDRVGGAGAILVTSTAWAVSRSLPPLLRARAILTPDTAGHTDLGFGHPVLAFRPHAPELVLATRYARNYPIAVIEDPAYSCAPWAHTTAAWDLTDDHRLLPG
ncbi:hypothetical protein ACTD5D_40900 [Nocardia takedensis]|uniref:hypothetical protein n=1 Tax=Nocardia takedensis TaxID=259390 RepID=UPI003F75F8ED